MCSALYLLQPKVGTRRGPAAPLNPDFVTPKQDSWRRRRRRGWWSDVCSMSMFVILMLLFVKSTSAASTKSLASTSSSLLSSTPSLASSIQFTQSEYQGSIAENSMGKVYVIPESRMGIYSPDSSLKIRFRIRSGDPEGFFKAESQRIGDFVFLSIRTRTNKQDVLNRERRDHYTLEIRAKIKSSSRASNRKRSKEPKTLVHIEVTDTNDLDPFFQPSRYSFKVPEDAELHSSVGTVRAEDADLGINGEIYFGIQNSDQLPQFGVDPMTGVISVTRPLSFKEQSKYAFNVFAVDRGEKPRYGKRQADTASVQIEVVEVNLHSPVMQIQHLPQVVEQSNADIYAIIRINDPDPGRHGEVKSVEIIEGDSDAHFRIRKSREDEKEFNIEVMRLLDREISPNGYNLTLKAMDNGIPAKTSFKNIHVQLADLNDHSPIFDHEIYEVRVPESAPVNSPMVRLKATDGDSGRNAKVRIQITAGNDKGHFKVNPKTGMLYTSRRLDAETKSSYTLTVTALDQASRGARRQSSAKVNVLVTDVNDNNPVFRQRDKEVIYFNENQPAGTKVIKLRADDRDSGENGFVSYSIANVNEVPFEIDQVSGDLTSTRLIDFESDKREYHLIIRASDWGKPYRRQSQIVILVRIRDINDNRPQFERIMCSGTVPRNTPIGREILTLSAIDFDANNLISYRIVNGNSDGCFGLDSSKGALSVICDLQTLPSTRRELNVTATDGQHFSDVTTISISFKQSDSYYTGIDDFNFNCEETKVSQRLTEILALAKAHDNYNTREDPAIAMGEGAMSRFGANIHRPEFDVANMPREIWVNETVPVGSALLKVKAFDRDLGFNGDLLYVISDGDQDSVFKIDMMSGLLTIESPLDREFTSGYVLNITAYDQGWPQKSVSRLLNIYVQDCNDNPPRFFKSAFSFFFPENTLPNTSVVTLNATDPDEGVNGEVRYKLMTETETFRIDSVSGLLVVKEQLDRETKEYYDLRIKAIDSDPVNPLSSFATVRVRVLDVNDVAPTFSSSNYLVKTREDLPVGSVVGMVNARDPDFYQGGEFRYSLVDDAADFSIDEISGTVRVRNPLDFEKKQLYNLTIRATDEGSPSWSSIAHFIIEVIDVNENLHAPRFPTLFLKSAVPENMPIGSHVVTVKASDPDEGDSGRISYSLREGDGLGSFYIDNEGKIKTLVELDRESKSFYWLTVFAMDGGSIPLTSKLYVYVEVLDVNDNVPMTEEPIYFTSVRENSKAFSPILTLKSFDADLSDKTRISYDIIAGNPQSLFHIDPKSGVISTTKRILDRETQSEHVLEVLVNDNGKPPLNSSTRVIINIEDDNDNAPEFLERFLRVSVPETLVIRDKSLQNDQNVDALSPNLAESSSTAEKDFKVWEELFENSTWESFDFHSAKLGRPLFRSLALDRDIGENGRIFYSMKTGEVDNTENKLQIDRKTGIVYAIDSVKAGEQFDLLLKATDGGKKSSLGRVSLTIAEKSNSKPNVNKPEIEPLSPVQVFESDKIGHLVTLVAAKDDDDDKLWYSFHSGNEDDAFYISPDLGNVLLAKKLDARQRNEYNLIVQVSDGNHTSRQSLQVSVLAVEAQMPEFQARIGKFEVDVAENASVGQRVMKIDVFESMKSPQNLVFSFHAVQELNSLSKFKINPSNGIVSVNKKLDNERTKLHIFTVSVKDLTSSVAKANFARLFINVIDHNDHAPKFMSKLIQTKLPESSSIGTEVIEMLALDPDSGENGRISYSISGGNVGNTFTIDQELGVIKVGRPLDLAVQSDYTLLIMARDHGVPSRSTTVPVHILLTMSEDSPPKLSRPHFATEVYENLDKGSFVLQVKASGNSMLKYKILDGNEDSVFFINPSNGILMTQKHLDFETKHLHNMTIEVRNMVGMRVTCTVHVNILDVNDNEPHFEKREFSGKVSESASVGSLILVENHKPLVIKADDADSGVNSLLQYEIQDAVANEYFAIDESTGAIRTTRDLDYEFIKHFEFLVSVSDRGIPMLSSPTMANVKIEVLDENDSPPRFQSREYVQLLLLPTFENVAVIQVEAKDSDSEAQTDLRYSILSGNDDQRFKIDAQAGQILIADAESVEMSSHYALEVGVSDGKFTDRCMVQIQAEKSDNSGLAFGKKKYEAKVLENTTKSDMIVILTVLGTSLNENLKFSLLNPTDFFIIGETSGAIRTTGKPFDRESQETYVLVAEVRSEDHSRILPRVARVEVHVEVLDINDNAPMFVNQPYHAIMSKDLERDASILKVSAIDKDRDENGQIFYQLSKGNGELFRVGRQSGQITLRQVLESYQSHYRLTITAYDGGTPPFSEECSVLIKVIDKSVPMFTQQFYKAKVRENVELFSPVISVKAEGPTLEDGKLIYTIEAGNDEESFEIDYHSGVISVIDHLDFEKKQHHQLTIRATDSINGGYAEAIVLLGIEDVNDCRPEFKNQSYSVKVVESLPVGSNILTVTATDADTGINQDITYDLLRDVRNDSDHFWIESDTGNLFIKTKLDHENAKEHRIVIVARDHGVNSLSSTVTATITVQDTNDNPPVFEEPQYFMKLSDSATRGQVVGKVRAVDPDESDQSNLEYKIIGGNQHQIFSMNETNGLISLVNLHNFDQSSDYNFNVSVSDGVYSGLTKVQITLYSANSHSPKFFDAPYEVVFPENQPEGVRVAKVLALDEDRNDEITYSILSQKLSQLFNMDAHSGEIWSRKSFDREEQPMYLIPIAATDVGGRMGLSQVKVLIEDANDNKPQFMLSEYKVNIFANHTVGTEVMALQAMDLDEGSNGQLEYSIYENKTLEVSKIFKIHRRTGSITLKQDVSSFQNQIFQFFVRAKDKGYPRKLHSDVPVEIYIMSPLDRPPVFANREKKFFISENSPVGQVVASIHAKNELIGEERDIITYSIASRGYQDEEASIFLIGKEDGKLIVNGHIDREVKDVHQVTVMASTDASPALVAYFHINIQVLDKNDNAPTFHSIPYEVTLPEGADLHTEVVRVVAEDADHSNNGEISYSFAENSQTLASIFNLNTHDGSITTQTVLDFERQASYQLEVVASDNGKPRLSATTTVNINIVDVNDNPTTFSQRHYAAAINEGAPAGNIIFQLNTEDLDKEVILDVEFYIMKGDPLGQFQIKKNGELYVARELDRESISSYTLDILATDGTFVSNAKVAIEVLDDNDSPPNCKHLSYKRDIEENANSGTYILSVEASDADKEPNAKQIFYLTGQNSDYFTIDGDNGHLRTAMPLDREKISQFLLEAHVQDAGVPEWGCSSQIEITVLDVNDNAPEWSQKVFSATLKEDLPIGTVVIKAHAVDADIGRNKQIEYSLLESADGFFTIDSSSGIVSLSKPLDREQQAMYNLTVRAMDKGRPRLSSETDLIVMILDVNDNPPEFSSKYYFASISEDTSVGTDVVRVLATSKDTGVNADITYTIIGGNNLRKFKINPKSGVIMVSGPIDFEKSGEYFLTIQAQDGGDPPLSNHASVNITIKDSNDNAPIFTQPSYSALISESVPTGHHVISVSANDLDSGLNGKVTYSLISGDRHNQFAIDPNNGKVSVASALDREMISSYVLEVQAVDNGEDRQLSSTALLTVDVSDANDNPPIFPEGNYTAYLQEDKPLDHVVLRFSVTDADESPNAGPFTFDIRSGNMDNAFRIVRDGSLRTGTQFNRNVRNKYFLQIRVFDNGMPPMYSDSFVTIHIIEESQYPPVVVPMQVSVLSYQDEFPGAVIGKVKASDEDKYDTLKYHLSPLYRASSPVPQSHLFEIDQNNGKIFAVQGLDAGDYNLNVSVTDGKFTTFSLVKVVVDSISDEMLENAVVIRLADISPSEFYNHYLKSFQKLLKGILNVESKNVQVLSLQSGPSRRSRSAKKSGKKSSNLDILVVVRKGNKGDYLPKEKLQYLLSKSKLNSQAEEIGLSILDDTSDSLRCDDTTCGENGICKEAIVMGDVGGEVTTIAMSGGHFIAPRFKQETQCQCHEGFSGDKCQIILNECARKPCPSFKLCVPDSSFQGYQCHCPSGLTGALCNVNVTSCGNSKCKIVNPMTFDGKSYAKYRLLRPIENHLSLSLGFKTLHATGNIMYSVGMVDYSVLEIMNGKLRYRFNFGSGEGLVALNDVTVNDGDWHEITVERHGNHAKITLDKGRSEEHGSAPGINDVLNIEDEVVYFGAEVVHHASIEGEDISKGFFGCLDDIRMDGMALPLHLHGSSEVAKLQRFHNVEFKCGELQIPGVCGSHPCRNGGTCRPEGETYVCNCPSRFTGSHCEYDLDPCASNPCLFGSKCVNLNNDYHCECPPKLSGKRCHYGKHCNPNPCLNGGMCEEGLDMPICKCRGFTGKFCTIDINECLHQNPCQNGGSCINSNGGFHCICPSNATGLYCSDIYDRSHPRRGRQDYALKLEEVVAIIASLFLIVVIVVFFVLCKKLRVKQGRSGSASYHIQNDFDGKQESIRLNHHIRNGNTEPAATAVYSQKLNNIDLAAQERPLLSPQRPLSSYVPNQQETAFTYMDPVRSYGSAADELENLPKISQDYIQNIKKPMAAVAPSVCNPIPDGACAADPGLSQDRNMYNFYPDKSKLPSNAKLRVNLPPSDSPAPPLKVATSLSSIQTSVAEDSSQRFFWDSYDLNDGAGAISGGASVLPKLHMVSERADVNPNVNTSTLPPPGKPVDPSRDIETLNEDDHTNDMDATSNADTEDEPQLGSVYPKEPMTKSFEELLASNEDINFADADDEDNNHGVAKRDFHLNNYLPTYNISETDTDEQTPMLARHDNSSLLSARFPAKISGSSKVSKSSRDLDSSSEMNASISALPEDDLSLPTLNGTNGLAQPPNESSRKLNSDLDNLCELEDSDDEDTPTVEVKPMPPLNPRVTRV